MLTLIVKLSFCTLLPCPRLTGVSMCQAFSCFVICPFLQMSYSRSRKLTWTSSCRLSLNHNQMSPCRQRRAWKTPCPRANPTAPSRSHPWGPVRSQRVSSSSLRHSHKQHHEQHWGCVENNRPYTQVFLKDIGDEARQNCCTVRENRFTMCFLPMQMCCGAMALDLSVPAQFPVAKPSMQHYRSSDKCTKASGFGAELEPKA